MPPAGQGILSPYRPLLLWSLGFGTGIGIWAAGFHSWFILLLLVLAGIACIASQKRLTGVFALGVALLGIAAGALRLAAFQTVPASDISHFADHLAPITVSGTVVSEPITHPGREMFLVRTNSITRLGQTQSTTGDVMVVVSYPSSQEGSSYSYGERVALRGLLETPHGATNPGAFSWRDYLARRGVYSQLHVKSSGFSFFMGHGSANLFLSLALFVHRHVIQILHSALPPTEASVLSGILIGSRSDLSPEVMSAFVHTGTVHILASAGLHVGILSAWLLALCRRLTLHRKLSAFLIIVLLWGYCLVCGAHPAVTRAVVMGTIYFGAILFEREPDLPTTLAAAALFILAIQPTVLLEASFQLSFLTVMTLAAAMPIWDHFWRDQTTKRIVHLRIRRIVFWALELAGVTLFAQIGSAPIVASAYNEVSVCGVFANLCVVPTLMILIPLGIAGILLSLISTLLGSVLLVASGKIVGFIVGMVLWFGQSDWGHRAIQTPDAFLIVVYYAAVLVLASFFSKPPTPMTASDEENILP